MSVKEVIANLPEWPALNVMTSGFSPNKHRLLGLCVCLASRPTTPEFRLIEGASQEDVEAVQPYTAVSWDMYRAMAKPKDHVLRDVVSLTEGKTLRIVSYTWDRFTAPFLRTLIGPMPVEFLDIQQFFPLLDEPIDLNYVRKGYEGIQDMLKIIPAEKLKLKRPSIPDCLDMVDFQKYTLEGTTFIPEQVRVMNIQKAMQAIRDEFGISSKFKSLDLDEGSDG